MPGEIDEVATVITKSAMESLLKLSIENDQRSFLVIHLCAPVTFNCSACKIAVCG